MKRGVSFSEYTVLIAVVLFIVSIALAGLGLAYEEMGEWFTERFNAAIQNISNGDQTQGEDRGL